MSFSCFVVPFGEPDAAQQAFQAVKDRCYEKGSLHMFDAVVVVRQHDGRLRILRAPKRPDGEWDLAEGQWFLAPGLAIALSPAVAVGSLLDTGPRHPLAVLDVIAGHVAGAVTRSDLRDLGVTFDSGEAALVVVAAAECAPQLETLMEEYGHPTSAAAAIDAGALEDDICEAAQQTHTNVEG